MSEQHWDALTQASRRAFRRGTCRLLVLSPHAWLAGGILYRVPPRSSCQPPIPVPVSLARWCVWNSGSPPGLGWVFWDGPERAGIMASRASGRSNAPLGAPAAGLALGESVVRLFFPSASGPASDSSLLPTLLSMEFESRWIPPRPFQLLCTVCVPAHACLPGICHVYIYHAPSHPRPRSILLLLLLLLLLPPPPPPTRSAHRPSHQVQVQNHSITVLLPDLNSSVQARPARARAHAHAHKVNIDLQRLSHYDNQQNKPGHRTKHQTFNL
ncbi:hypothetical protein B0T22DRAFT_49618 [Podospora appendiculata]|uniref:Uncharacterized protein n=1 Tax=Podospora appendiculata TaxID=314037 RepID=A0AAE0XHW9_9PEZI|nr:hypothetical protein B0T22DRAFT_49618 [Podospora appendiculata]